MVVHLNGRLVPAGEARVSVADRGFLFGDGVYEGLRSTRGHIIALDQHIERLRDGLRETRITGFDSASIGPRSEELLNALGLDSAFLYWQVTRGTPSDPMSRLRVPADGSQPTVFGHATPIPPIDALDLPAPRSAALIEDLRWTRGHVKSISLQGGVIASYEAQERGADEPIMHRNGLITEGAATNVFAAVDGRIVTPSIESVPILRGVTRALVLEASPETRDCPLPIDDLRRASEIVLIGTRTMVAPVTSLDGAPVGDGAVGPIARLLHERLVERIMQEVRETAHA